VQQFRVVHPFHPLCGQVFEQLNSREGLPEDRLYFEDPHGRAASIPKHFTDLGPMDPVIVMGKGRSLFRVGDLLALCSLIEASVRTEAGDAYSELCRRCNANDAAMSADERETRRG
jgi:Family of unknown function (DUF5372)